MSTEIHTHTRAAKPGEPLGYSADAAVEVIFDHIEEAVGAENLHRALTTHTVIEPMPGIWVAIVVTQGLSEVEEAQAASINNDLYPTYQGRVEVDDPANVPF